MTTKFEPAPTYADPVIVDETSGKAKFNPLWLKWFLNVVQIFDAVLSQSQSGTINHGLLSGLLGGAPGAHYHIDAAQHGAISAGLSVTVTLAKITGGGANGSLTFTSGILTAKVDPT